MLPPIETSTLSELISALSVRYGNATALHGAGRSLTFHELDLRSNKLGRALALASRRGPVAVLGRDSAESLVILFGAAKAGVPIAFLSYRLTARELAVILSDFRPSHLFVEASQAGTLRELEAVGALAGSECVGFGGLTLTGPSLSAFCDEATGEIASNPPRPEDVAALLYTSGTTGRPKGVALTHGGFLAIARELNRAGEDWWGLAADDVALHTLPLFHVGGLWWAVNVLARGVPLVMLPQFDAEQVLLSVETHGITAICLVPAMLRLVLERQALAPRKLHTLRTLFYGGAPIAKVLLAEAQATLQSRLVQFYGLTETGNTAVCLTAEDHADLEARPGVAGLPYPGVRLRCVDPSGGECSPGQVGEIWIHSPANMLEYWKRPEETRNTLAEGWIRTGDAGYRDENGYLYVCDRIKDMIISAGENIYPAEVEAAIQEHPAVKDVAVIGIPDERWGEAVRALVVCSAPLELRELLQFLRGKIADFKLPRSLETVSVLPRTPSGKLKKHELRAPHWAGWPRQVN